MTAPRRDNTERELSEEELAEQDAAELPDREAMSLINANVAIPINIGAAPNVLSDGSTASGSADQTTPIQHRN